MFVFKLLPPQADGFPSASGFFKLKRRRVKDDELSSIIGISYAWGSLDHTVAESWSLGPGKMLTIKLGIEWNHFQFLEELARLSTESWLWIDQLCLDQGAISSEELNISIPMIYKMARVLVLLPGNECTRVLERATRATKRDWLFATKGGENIARENSYRSSPTIWNLMDHRKECSCLHGIEMWLQRVWPWQEAAYACRLKLRLVAGSGKSSAAVSFDALTLLRQVVLNKRIRSGQAPEASGSSRDEEGDMMFLRLLCGDEVEFAPFATVTGDAMLAYLSSYCEQNRVCTKDSDLISAVAPAIGARTIAQRSLSEGVRDMIAHVETSTHSVYVGPLPRGVFGKDNRAHELGASFLAHERTFSSLEDLSPATSIALLHGTHFAAGYEPGKPLRAFIDYELSVYEFPKPQPGRMFDLGLLLRAMPVSQRRMLVRWLKSWTPRDSPYDDVIASLKEYASQRDVTSEGAFNWKWRYRVVSSARAFNVLALMLLRVIEDEPSDLQLSITTSCRIVLIEKKGEVLAVGYVRSDIDSKHIVVAAAGDCLMLGVVQPSVASEIERYRRGGQTRPPAFARGPHCVVVGRVPFVAREALGHHQDLAVSIGRSTQERP